RSDPRATFALCPASDCVSLRLKTMNDLPNPHAEATPPVENWPLTRRQFLSRCGVGFGAVSLAGLLGQHYFETPLQAADAFSPLAPKTPPLPARAKRVVHIFAQGAPSHVDTWDPKPLLKQHDG